MHTCEASAEIEHEHTEEEMEPVTADIWSTGYLGSHTSPLSPLAHFTIIVDC